MTIITSAPALKSLQFSCLYDGTVWVSDPGEYTVNWDCDSPESYDGDYEGSFDAESGTTILTSCSCPFCRKVAYHGVVYAGAVKDSDDSNDVDSSSAISSDDDDENTGADIETKSLQFTFDVEVGNSFTYTSSEITSDMVVAAMDAEDDVQGGEWVIKTSNGSLTITGTIAAAGSVTLVLTQAGIDEDLDEEEDTVTIDGTTITFDDIDLTVVSEATGAITNYHTETIPLGMTKVIINLTGNSDKYNGYTFDSSTVYAQYTDNIRPTVSSGEYTDSTAISNVKFADNTITVTMPDIYEQVNLLVGITATAYEEKIQQNKSYDSGSSSSAESEIFEVPKSYIIEG